VKTLQQILDNMSSTSLLVLGREAIGKPVYNWLVNNDCVGLNANSSSILERYLYILCNKTLPPELYRDHITKRTEILQRDAQKFVGKHTPNATNFWQTVENEWALFYTMSKRAIPTVEVKEHVQALNDALERNAKKLARKNATWKKDIDLQLPELTLDNLSRDSAGLFGNVGQYITSFLSTIKGRMPDLAPTKGEHQLAMMIYCGQSNKRQSGEYASMYLEQLRSLTGHKLEMLLENRGALQLRRTIAIELLIINELNLRNKGMSRGQAIRQQLDRIALRILELETDTSDRAELLAEHDIVLEPHVVVTDTPPSHEQLMIEQMVIWIEQLGRGDLKVILNPLNHSKLLVNTDSQGITTVVTEIHS
jgi:hypothetical protein